MLNILFFSLGNERTKLFLKCKQLECKSLVSQKIQKRYQCTFRWQEGLRCGHRKMSSKESEKEKCPTCSKRTWQARTAFMWRVGGSVGAAAWLQSELVPTTRVQMLRKSILQENQICAFVSVNICEFPPTSRCHTFTLKFLCGATRNGCRNFSHRIDHWVSVNQGRLLKQLTVSQLLKD